MKWLQGLFGGLFLVCSLAAHALTPDQALRIAQGESDERIAALNEVVAAADPALPGYVQALLADEVKVAGGKAFVVRDGKTVDAATGAAAALPADGVEDVVNPNRVRRELESALAALKLFSPDRAERAKAAADLKDQADEAKLPVIEKAEAAETDPAIKAQLGLLKAAVLIASEDKDKRLAAARLLIASDQPATKSLLLERLGTETDPEVKAALNATLSAVSSRLVWGRTPGRGLHRHQPGIHPAAGRARPGHHLWPDGRHQHGAR